MNTASRVKAFSSRISSVNWTILDSTARVAKQASPHSYNNGHYCYGGRDFSQYGPTGRNSRWYSQRSASPRTESDEEEANAYASWQKEEGYLYRQGRIQRPTEYGQQFSRCDWGAHSTPYSGLYASYPFFATNVELTGYVSAVHQSRTEHSRPSHASSNEQINLVEEHHPHAKSDVLANDLSDESGNRAPPLAHVRIGSTVSRQRPQTPAQPTSRGQKPSLSGPRELRREAIQHTLAVPHPTPAYLAQAQSDLVRISQPQRLLIVLDLNGTLLYRQSRARFIRRPNLHKFLNYLFSQHDVMVWSSARPQNVKAICQQILTPRQQASLVGIWARDTLRLTPAQYEERTQVYKQLSWIWQDSRIQSSRCKSVEREDSLTNDDVRQDALRGDDVARDAARDDPVLWSQANTVLIDDSLEKARSEPHNLLRIDEFVASREQMGTDVLSQVIEYLEWIRSHDNVSACMRTHPWYFDATYVPKAQT